ncbi:MAG: hypothetical protein LIQ31_07335, partial [Planctomycetes bacterium]|nr:hypothetical protein [Planctomycetota bacterium]
YITVLYFAGPLSRRFSRIFRYQRAGGISREKSAWPKGASLVMMPFGGQRQTIFFGREWYGRYRH